MPQFKGTVKKNALEGGIWELVTEGGMARGGGRRAADLADRVVGLEGLTVLDEELERARGGGLDDVLLELLLLGGDDLFLLVDLLLERVGLGGGRARLGLLELLGV